MTKTAKPRKRTSKREPKRARARKPSPPLTDEQRRELGADAWISLARRHTQRAAHARMCELHPELACAYEALHSWVKRRPEVHERLKRATALRVADLETALANTPKVRDPRARAVEVKRISWALSKVDRQSYGDHARVEHSGPGGGPIEHRHQHFVLTLPLNGLLHADRALIAQGGGQASLSINDGRTAVARGPTGHLDAVEELAMARLQEGVDEGAELAVESSITDDEWDDDDEDV